MTAYYLLSTTLYSNVYKFSTDNSIFVYFYHIFIVLLPLYIPHVVKNAQC